VNFAPALLAPALQAAEQAPASGSSETKIVQLVPANSAAPGHDDDPEPPKPQQGKRPSLKRVK
jgi:hypothetical protein